MTPPTEIDDLSTTGSQSAATVYGDRLTALSQLQLRDKQRERALGYAKLTVAAVTIAAAVWARHDVRELALVLAPVVAFVVLAVRQEQLLATIRYRTRAMAFYDRGMLRLAGNWARTEDGGEGFLDPAHPYARDLDLFGHASLFQFLSSARTRSGEETLAHWLLASAPPAEVAARQIAVRELQGRLDFRERLFATGETVRASVHPEALCSWGGASAVFAGGGVRVTVSVLAVLWAVSILIWAVWGFPIAPLLMTVLNFAYSHRLYARHERAAGAIEAAAKDLALLAKVLALVETEQVKSPKLKELQAELQSQGELPSQAIRRLARMVELIEARHSLFARPFDLVTFWSTQLICSAEHWQRQYGSAIRNWLSAVGQFEALVSLSSFAYEHPDYPMAELVAGEELFEAQGLAHPLLPSQNAATNDVRLCQGQQLMILSGPNMAGKSTFIRSIGVNAVLAQCGAPVRAHRLRMSPLAIAASICVLDSLADGMSRFYAEIHRIKLIADLAQGSTPVLFLLDELLSGTNSHDRLVGTQFVLKSLLDHRAIGVVSTHDLALTKIPEMLGGRAFNCHFEDRYDDGRLIFDYKLKAGIVQTSNALKLMKSIGLGVDV